MTDNHESLWAREGDLMVRIYPEWTGFASNQTPVVRHYARKLMHGFDFRVESVNGTKTMVKEEAP